MPNEMILVLIMAAAGIVGGAVSYLLPQPKEGSSPPVFKDRELYKSVFIGFAASFLVPLFLQLISSNLLDQVLANEDANAAAGIEGGIHFNSLMILTSFCLIAAMSSRKFIEIVTNGVLDSLQNKLEQMNQKVVAMIDTQSEDSPSQALAAAATISPQAATPRLLSTELPEQTGDNRTEPLETEDAPGESSRPGFTALAAAMPSLSPEDAIRYKVLCALICSNYTFRAVEGIAQETGIEQAMVYETLRRLMAEKLVEQAVGTKGVRFHITPLGRKQLERYGSK